MDQDNDKNITWADGFHERDAPYYAAVGYLCHQWNSVEYFTYSLGPKAMGLPLNTHDILFRHMSILAVQNFVVDYTRRQHDDETANQVEHVNQYVDVCRRNRNIIVHSSPTHDFKTSVEILRSRPDKNRKEAKHYSRSTAEVRRVSDDCEVAGQMLINLELLISPPQERERMLASLFPDGDWRDRLLLKLPLPLILASNPQDLPERSEPL